MYISTCYMSYIFVTSGISNNIKKTVKRKQIAFKSYLTLNFNYSNKKKKTFRVPAGILCKKQKPLYRGPGKNTFFRLT